MSKKDLLKEEAKKLGLKRFFTGEACLYGHVAERLVSNGNCLACVEMKRNTPEHKEKEKLRFLRNQEKEKTRRKKRYEREREKAIEYSRNWVLNNKERAREVYEVWYAKNRIEQIEKVKIWSVENKDKSDANKRRYRGRKVNAEGDHTPEDIEALLNWQNFLCAGCDVDLTTRAYHIDHIMPLSRGGSNWPWNLQILCPTCNISKSDKHPDDWVKPKFKCEPCA
jgi:5-methylcytosine-specific restriction endonuclease McrA